MNAEMTIDVALKLLTAILANASQISDAVAAAQARGDKALSPEDSQKIRDHDSIARIEFQAEIDKAEAAENAS